MKKIALILSLFLIASHVLMAQNDDEKIRDKMSEYIQQRMRLNKTEAERFSPVFLRYFREWRNTLKENRTDKLILQQKVVELRLHYRTEFKDIIGEKRSNDVFRHQEKFISELQTIRQERMQNRKGPRNRIRNLSPV
ncbi:MAG: hypothetical protein ABIU11_02015 [Chitinophagaceae bacterium]